MNHWIALFVLGFAAFGCADDTINLPPSEEGAGHPDPGMGLPPANGGAAGQAPAANGGENPPPPPSEDPPAGNDDPPAASGSDFNATAAVKITGNVSWPGGLAIQQGSGLIEIWFKANLSHTGQIVSASGPVCAVKVPDFHTSAIAGGDTHGTVIPQSVWNAPGIPATAFEVQLGGTEPGASLVANPVAMLTGVQMNDGLNDPWPDSYRNTTAVDHDGDGNPGITALAAAGGPYSNPRVDLFNPQLRADRLFLAMRTIIGLDGRVNSCDAAEGSATLILDQRVVGCALDNGQPCQDAHVATIDQNSPVFQVDGATFKLQRVADGAACDQIIATLP